MAAVAFWNVENLYDTINDRWKNDEEFTPGGLNAWTAERYTTKIDRLAEVISRIASDDTPDGPALVGLCEVENKKVLDDLVHSPRIAARNYRVVHIDGPDARGIETALLYNPKYFRLISVNSYKVRMVTDTGYKTRDVLVAGGLFGGEKLTVLVNHWPSRRGGELRSRPNRMAAAAVVRKITDSLLKIPSAGIIVMGDFNDDPVNTSVKEIIGTYWKKNEPVAGKFFNPMEKLYREGIGTLAWQDSWNLFDQLLLSDEFLKEGSHGWKFYSAAVFNKQFLRADNGNFRGYPFRTYSGGAYTGGYSDHFPAYIILAKEKK